MTTLSRLTWTALIVLCCGVAVPVHGKTILWREHVFTFADGVGLPLSLIQGRDGAFYGTAAHPEPGALFRYSPLDGVTRASLAAVGGGTPPRNPVGDLVQAPDGSFYGVTQDGGAFGFGTIIRWTLPDRVSVLHSFTGGSDGMSPRAGLTIGADGALYGTTALGGDCFEGILPGLSYGGTLFRITFTGVLTTLHAFGCEGDGRGAPLGGLSRGGDGSLYGTTYHGGHGENGTVYRLHPGGGLNVVHEFGGTPGIGRPYDVISASDGTLYALAEDTSGLQHSAGGRPRIVRLDPSGGLTVLYAAADIVLSRQDRLLRSGDGSLYLPLHAGTTSPDRADPRIVRVASDGRASTLHHFTGGGDGNTPYGRLVEASDGGIYGVSMQGGSETNASNSAIGVLYRLIPAASGDFAGDATTDLTLYRPSTGNWYALTPETPSAQVIPWGARGDEPVPGDFDGDGLTDAAVFRPSTGTWWVRHGRDASFSATAWGASNDRPVAGDYDGDGRTDLAVFRPADGTWYTLRSNYGSPYGHARAWGNGDDVPVPGDYDGDGVTDLAVFRPSEGIWYLLLSDYGSPSSLGIQWGNATDVPVPGDYDGDGRTDIAVFRPADGTWYIARSSTGLAYGFVWGNGADIPVPGDYDGDERTDVAVYRPSTRTWFIVYSHTGRAAGYEWGAPGDVPVVPGP